MTRLKSLFGRRSNAVVVAYLGLLTLIPALFLPAVTIERFGALSTYSIVSSVLELVNAGNVLIAGIIFLFSALFPVLKLALVLYLAMRPTPRAGDSGRSLVKLMLAAGKYSMLDVFVIALLIVAFKLGGVIKAEIDFGLYLFILSIVLSTLANLMLLASLDPASAETRKGDEMSAPEEQRAKTGGGGLVRTVVLILLPLILGALGAALYFTASSGTVATVLVQRLPGVDLTIVSTPDTPDYALQLLFRNGELYRSPSKPDTPIGNGIVFDIPDVEMALLQEVSLWDDNSLTISDMKLSVLPDAIVDRVRIGEARVVEGQRMRFQLIGEPAPQRTVALFILGTAGFWLVLGLGAYLVGTARRQP